MSNVTLSIGGRSFTVASADGEESHVQMLARMIDERLKRMGGAAGQSESRMLLFASLLLADELHEAHNNPDGAPPPPPVLNPATIKRIEALTARVEKLAAHLEEQDSRA